MKRLVASISVLLILSCYMWSCEKDDICPEGVPTTPNLVVEFYNADNRNELRAVDSLKYYVEGMADTIEVRAVSNIRIPLRVDAESVTWHFILGTQITGGYTYNTDILEFRYTTQQEYVSRACGYKTIFTLVHSTDAEPNPVLTDSPGESNLWIRDYETENEYIETEDEVHIKIYF